MGQTERLLQVGELAERGGKTVRAIHHYEELGLLKPATRSKGGYRLFHEDALTRIRWVGMLQDLGLSLSEVRDWLRDLDDASSKGVPVRHCAWRSNILCIRCHRIDRGGSGIGLDPRAARSPH